MSDRRTVDELTIEDLEQILIVKRREARAERMRRLRDIVAADASAGAERTDRTRYLAAKASIELAEPVRQQFEVFELSQPLQESMKVKRSLMQNTIDAYTAAADYGVQNFSYSSSPRPAP